MTSTTFFIIFIPILAILLLAINLLLAPHNPYQEKDSVFECGFHSFLGQNRTQFSISFFIFGLLFLLFDLEILLVYPYSVSSYTNDIYGLVIMMVFFVLLTLGFIFELGKNALTIESRQTFFNGGDLSTPHAFVSGLTDSMNSLYMNQKMTNPLWRTIYSFVSSMGKRFILNKVKGYLSKLFIFLLIKHPGLYKRMNYLFTTLAVFNVFFYSTVVKLHKKFKDKLPILYSITLYIYITYLDITRGNLSNKHICSFLLLGFYIGDVNYLYCVIVMVLASRMKTLIYTSYIKYNYPNVLCFLSFLLDIIFLLSLTMCIQYVTYSILWPFFKKIILTLSRVWDGILNMMGSGGEPSEFNGKNTPSPNPKKDGNIVFSDSDEKKKDKLISYTKDFTDANIKINDIESNVDKDTLCSPLDLYRDYAEYLPEEDKEKLIQIANRKKFVFEFGPEDTVQDFWKMKRKGIQSGWENINTYIQVFEKNSKNIQIKLGGDKSYPSFLFRKDFNKFKEGWSANKKMKESIVKEQLSNASLFEKSLRKENSSLYRMIDMITKN